MRTHLRAALSLVILLMIAGDAHAERLAISEVHGEADVADEAGAISLLVRSALAGPGCTLLPVPGNFTLGGAPALLTKINADHALLLDLARDGTGLRLSLAIAGGGRIEAAMIRSGSGDLHSLAQGVVERVTKSLNCASGTVRDVGLAKLRPFVIAIRLAGSDPKAAARALAEADPLTVLSIGAIEEGLRGLPARVEDRTLSAIAARALRDLVQLEMIGTGTDPPAVAARVFAALLRSNLTGVDEVLQRAPRRQGLFAIARVVLAERLADNAVLADRVKEGLASDQVAGVLAVASLLIDRLPVPVRRAVLAYAEKPGMVSPGIASRIGLAVALSGTEPARAFALVSVREHDAYELKQLEGLLAKGSDVTTLRLLAELAMRRSDGSDTVAIGALIAAAPDDLRANRYQGWMLMGEKQYREAAAAFAKAGQRGEQARALAAANDLTTALATIEGPPTTAGELVIATRVAISQNRHDDAARLVGLAESSAPVSPEVHAAVIELGRAEPARIEIARMIVNAGSTTVVSVATAAPVGTQATKVGRGSGTMEDTPIVRATDVAIDPTPLLPLLDAFPGLAQLQDRRLAIAELSSDAPWYSMRRADATPVGAGLVKLLSAPPYGLRVGPPTTIDAIDAGTLARVTESAPVVLIYRVVPDGGAAVVTLTLVNRGATGGEQFSSTISMPGVIGWDTMKLIPLGVIGLLLLLGGGLWLTRFLNKIVIEIERAPDVDDEVLCVVITKSEARPVIGDPAKFRAAAKKAGSRGKSRSATLIASGETFRVPSGSWYVHLYGTFQRGSELKTVPETCSELVEVKRGERVVVEFSLTSKLAEITVLMETEPRRGIAVWTNDATHDKRYTDAAGETKLQLPIGTHTVHIDVAGKRFERAVQVVSAKMQRIVFNVARETRLAQGIAFDANEVVPAELELAPGQNTIAMPTSKKPKIATDETMALPAGPAARPGTAATELPVMPMIRLHPRARTPVPGELLLGRYKIVSELGRGAMGVVHRALDEKLEREVAIKEMAEDLMSNHEAMRLFTQEAKALAQLNHTNIVAMYDQITATDKVYMIMEFVDGQPLADILEARGKFAWRDAVAIIDQVCAGLAYAHARKVIHRDIKPANIFVTKDRTAKLGDFGLARVMREVSIQRTAIRGTPLYMAPEQIKGTDVDHRTDLYAIGCMFFELVCGRPPFIDGDILYAQMHAPPPSPRELCSDLPESLDALILSLIAKSSDDRPGSANEVRAALKSL